METFRKLLFLLNSHERKRLVLLLIMITIGALLDMIGVTSILPFMAVLTNPSIDTNLALNILYQASYKFGLKIFNNFFLH